MAPFRSLTPHWRSRIVAGTVVLVIGLLGLQFARFIIPDFRIDNPPVNQQIAWDSPETARLWQQACADCHSNETRYPWYSRIAPVGWLVAHDVHEGRDALNVSEDRRIEWDEMIEEIEDGSMPLPVYRIMHPAASLTATEQETLMAGLRATFR